MHIVTSPAARIIVHTERRQRMVAAATDENDRLTHTVFDLGELDGYEAKFPNKKIPAYLRVSVTDATGAVAQTRAYFREEWKK